MRTRVAWTALALPLALAACGGDDEQAAKEAVSEMFDEPPCEEIDVIEDDFSGCTEDGAVQAAVVYDCKDGSKLVAAGSVFGKVGKEAVHVPDAADSEEYAAVWDECKGF